MSIFKNLQDTVFSLTVFLLSATRGMEMLVWEGRVGAMVLVYDEATGYFIGTTVTDKNGNYTINNLATGKHYRVDVEVNDDFSSVEGTASVLVDGGDTLQNFNLNK